MDKNRLSKLLDNLSLEETIPLADIPNLELYAEQLVKFMEEKLGKYKRTGDEKVLTKTMINNYTKDKVLMSSVNKKYTQEHVILLTLLYNLKSILSIKDIKYLFKPILKNMETRHDDVLSLEEIYQTFLDIEEAELENEIDTITTKMNLIKDKTQDINKKDKSKAEWFLLALMLIAQANAHKRLAEKIIDCYFKK